MNWKSERGEDREQPGEEGPRKAEVHAEEAKDRQTSHWDIDYMTAEEIESAHREGRQRESDEEGDGRESEG